MRKDEKLHGLSAGALAAVVIGSVVAAAPALADADRRAAFEAAASAAFTEADADGSGELSAAEFGNFHDILRAKHETLRFTQLDTDGSGGLSEAELGAGRPGPGGHGAPGF